MVAYGLYTKKCLDEKRVPVKPSYYRNIFNTKFNLSFHKPQSDRCTVCDELNNIIDYTDNLNDKNAAILKKDYYLKNADRIRQNKNSKIELGKQSTYRVVITFDLQKTLPTPVLSWSQIYYSRQLWNYNLCVHNLMTKPASMFM